jgi:hypothetical protein
MDSVQPVRAGLMYPENWDHQCLQSNPAPILLELKAREQLIDGADDCVAS